MFDNSMLKVQEYCKRMTTRLVACRAVRRTGRERAYERRSGPLDFLEILCSISKVVLKVVEVGSRRWVHFALAVGGIAYAGTVIYEWAGRGERGIS
jgi:hypothetical protein